MTFEPDEDCLRNLRLIPAYLAILRAGHVHDQERFQRMQEQIRGWRQAAERTGRRRSPRQMPLAPSARIMGAAYLLARRVLARMARGETAESPGGISRIGGADIKRIVGGLGLLAAGAGVVRWLASRPGETMTRDGSPRNRWIMVTINCAPQRLASRADLPEPITRLGDAVDIKICPAPGDRGTELGARLRDATRMKMSGIATRKLDENPRRTVQEALRQAKSLIETGEVLRPDWPPSTHPTPAGKLLELAGRRGGRL